MPTNFLIRSRHHSIYYFRRRVPTDISHNFKNNLLLRSLNTANKRIAVILARNLACQTDNLFEEIRRMNNKTGNNPMAGLILKVDFNANKEPISFTLDAQEHETEAAKALISTVLNVNNIAANNTTLVDQSNAPVASSKDFQTYIDEYLQKAGIKPNTKASYKSKFEFAKNYFGNSFNVLAIEQLGIVHFSEHVKSLMSNETTQGLYIQIVVTFINWHRARIGLSPLNSKTLIPKRKTPEYEDREEFSLDDMHVIFKNAFTYSRREPHKWWSTIAVAFMGCRIEEICQVNLETDLVHDIKDNIWYFQFDEKPDRDGVIRKSLKKLSSHRRVPIHSALIKYGFIDYLNSQKKQNATRPFENGWEPRIVPKDSIYKWSQYATKWGGRELTQLDKDGLLKRGDKTYFHSMRHTVARLMQESGVSSEISEAIAGRSAGAGEQERYGKIKNNHLLLSRDGIEKALNPLVEILQSVANR